MKNNDLEEIHNKFGRRFLEINNFVEKITFVAIGDLRDDYYSSLSRYITGCLLYQLLDDKSYFSNSIINEPSEVNLFMEEVYKTLVKKRHLRSYFGIYNEILDMNIKHVYNRLFINGFYKPEVLDIIDEMCVFIQKLNVDNCYPVFSSFISISEFEIYYTNDPHVYKKIILGQLESMVLFVEKYYQGNYKETVPVNLVHMCLQESYTFLQGNVSIDDIFNTISTKVLETIELDKYDPNKAGYYCNIIPEDFSNLLYLNTCELLKMFSGNFSQLNEMNGEKYLKSMDFNKIIIWAT